MLLFEFDICEPWLDTTRIAEQVLFVNRILVGLLSETAVSNGFVSRRFNGCIQSGKSPAGTQMFDPSVRAAGLISGAGESLALRHSVRAGSDRTAIVQHKTVARSGETQVGASP